MSSTDPRPYLLHIRECCDRLQECAGLRASATVPAHLLLDLGEASRKIGPEFRAAHPELPWREMNDLRNVLIHNYEGADPALVWGIVEREIPRVLEAVHRLLQPPSEPNSPPPSAG